MSIAPLGRESAGINDDVEDLMLGDAPIAEEVECCICQEALQSDVTQLSCTHMFHQHCIDSWTKQNPSNATCPLCRVAYIHSDTPTPPAHSIRTVAVQLTRLKHSHARWFIMLVTAIDLVSKCITAVDVDKAHPLESMCSIALPASGLIGASHMSEFWLTLFVCLQFVSLAGTIVIGTLHRFMPRGILCDVVTGVLHSAQPTNIIGFLLMAMQVALCYTACTFIWALRQYNQMLAQHTIRHPP